MVYRLFVEKKEGFRIQEAALAEDIRTFLGVTGLKDLRVVNRYDVQGIDQNLLERCKQTVFSEVQVDSVYTTLDFAKDAPVFGVEYLPGQFDQRSDSCSQCIQLISGGERPLVKSAKVYILEGEISSDELKTIKQYLINPVESQEVSLEPVGDLHLEMMPPEAVVSIEGFTDLGEEQLFQMVSTFALAMDFEDLKMVQAYFKSVHRNPTETELKVIDTYWSDHCRHTTFLTSLDSIAIEDEQVQQAYQQYLALRKTLGIKKPITLMDLATIGVKALKKAGKLERLDESEEINACSVKINVDHDGVDEPWLLLFKNETHNHPTEIEPFGGSATCIGGAIRDPLSGRAYVYQAMRLSGSANPLAPVEDTLEGKLAQRKIAVTSANGNSSYGNQIGLATGLVDEIYHPGFVAKHLELGAVVGAVPSCQVRREVPSPGDKIILVGGKTGLDGCGGATGSSKSHDLGSLSSCSAEVQKGNAPEERKLQRLMRNGKASLLIKRCNDFGAGGVSVAVGELAEGLEIYLDSIPCKYEGMDGTSLAISESQERMAVVLDAADVKLFCSYAEQENLEATVIATVTEQKHLVMYHGKRRIVDLDRSFLDTNGAEKHASVWVRNPKKKKRPVQQDKNSQLETLMADLNICSKQGLSERFDSTIGGGSVLMPFGGKYQKTPAQVMAAKIPVLEGETSTCSVMTYGYDPYRMEEDPFGGAFDAVVHSVAKLAASGADLTQVYLSFQEYFGRVNADPLRWGLPFSSLLGALKAQLLLQKGAIGGKDSMSGSFTQIDVPPTLVSFAISCSNAGDIISPEFKKSHSRVVLLCAEKEEKLPALFKKVSSLIREKRVLSCYAVGSGGIAEALVKMGFGNRIGFLVETGEDLFSKRYGSFVLELASEEELGVLLGHTCETYRFSGSGFDLRMEALEDLYDNKLEILYPRRAATDTHGTVPTLSFTRGNLAKPSYTCPKPKVLIPVFPGTNCEYDLKRALDSVGAQSEIFVINNASARHVQESANLFARKLADSQILCIPGGFSGGDEPDGSGKFIASFMRNPQIAEEITRLLEVRDGLACGICNGFQALVKLGLLPYGKIKTLDASCPTLTFNTLARHQSMLIRTRVASNSSPWLSNYRVGDISMLPISHGEGRFVCDAQLFSEMEKNGQIATQYVDQAGFATMEMPHNPNGSMYAIEGITSADGKVFGRMAHSERFGSHLYKNTPYVAENGIFRGAVEYFS
ncbi:phosphoribosylformylglycinamidine synthase, clade II [Sphaerochaeta pleomorpha str. Grapes]|uniref:Phosphoribosylformylglycinamidine synthase, clade II n=1 Tax=Sphaerochaeta pleomorpha (strain ATCC BAA-1885 / DSM 22778 / Grapes) TaxID=158190 RepID=G8QVA9_SPHPG|nr:phosphoribosylformylglycinamidine synthase [Sphaerochaeta pleomorpha]AEV30424.1 phosphoribosylformylglycinamidine synthase, clade II [Sphaerochaeta pleomorpha str. Grapes]